MITFSNCPTMGTRDLSSNSTAADAAAVELEALRQEDSSWHPCRVSLSSSGVELIVDYGNTDSEDTIVSEEEAIACLRIRSIPLDDDDCVHIQEGDRVLATPKSQSKRHFFDAEVEKVLRVRHSKKVHCRCNFMIKWLHQDLKGGTLTVTSSSVMKLAAKSINEHPTVSAFLSMQAKRTGFSSCSPLPTITVDLDFDVDLRELLEKQIEYISSLADMSNKRVSDNGSVEDQNAVNYKEQNPCRVAAASKLNKSHVQAPPDHKQLKRTTRGSQNLRMGIEIKDPSPPAPSIQEELPETRSPLNPLAARAAFASLMSQMPQIATSVPFEPEKNKDGNSLISPISASRNTQFMVMDASSIMLTKEKETESNTSQLPDSRASFEYSVAKTKVSQPPEVTRLTRSAIKKGSGILDGGSVEQKLQPSTSPRRFTRSAVCKAKEPQTVEAKHRMEENKLGKNSAGDCSQQKVAVPERSALEDEELITSRNDSAVELLSAQEMNISRQKQERNKMHEVERNGLRNSTSKSRFTRSAVHMENGITSMTAPQGLEADKLARNTKLNSCEGNVPAAKGSVLETTDWFSSPFDSDGDSPHIEENPNGGKMSRVVKATEKTEGKFTVNGESSRSLKRKGTPLKKTLRQSPRLQFLPRTRSQNKS